MSWHKITLPLLNVVNPTVVHIGDLAKAVYEKENKPAGFAMFHATRASVDDMNDKFLIYLTPVASELCTEIAENFTLEPCDVPARDEPDVAFVFGDPLMKGQLKDKFEPEPGTVEWTRMEKVRLAKIRAQEEYEAAQAELAAKAAAAQAESESPPS
jgi:hypothetical protein